MGKPLKPIAEQVMVVTGASSGIGLATALAAAECGAKLVLNARSEETLRDLVKEIRASGAEAAYVAGDVAERGVTERLAAMAIETFGRIDTWVNDAGVASCARLGEASDEDNRRLFETNFWGVVYGSFAGIPELRKTEGVLINLGSEVSDDAVPLQGMYPASKHAVKGFTDTLQVELLQDHIPVTVTLIEPGAAPDPLEVVEAILEAASAERHAIDASSTEKLSSALARLAPVIANRMAAKPLDRPLPDEPARDAARVLYAPSMTGRAYGRGGTVRKG